MYRYRRKGTSLVPIQPTRNHNLINIVNSLGCQNIDLFDFSQNNDRRKTMSLQYQVKNSDHYLVSQYSFLTKRKLADVTESASIFIKSPQFILSELKVNKHHRHIVVIIKLEENAKIFLSVVTIIIEQKRRQD